MCVFLVREQPSWLRLWSWVLFSSSAVWYSFWECENKVVSCAIYNIEVIHGPRSDNDLQVILSCGHVNQPDQLLNLPAVSVVSVCIEGGCLFFLCKLCSFRACRRSNKESLLIPCWSEETDWARLISAPGAWLPLHLSCFPGPGIHTSRSEY